MRNGNVAAVTLVAKATAPKPQNLYKQTETSFRIVTTTVPTDGIASDGGHF